MTISCEMGGPQQVYIAVSHCAWKWGGILHMQSYMRTSVSGLALSVQECADKLC